MSIDNSFALIVPSYNSAKYLPDLFASIYGGESSLGKVEPQTLLPTEIVICDDSSQDNTEEVVEEFRKDHSEISYVRHATNRGTPSACNSAISYTNCRFITRIDSDDMREPQSFELMLKAQLENTHSLIYDNVRIFLNGQKQGNIWVMDDYNFDLLLQRNFIHAGIMFPRRSWEECGGYPEEFIHGRDDWSFNVSLGSIGYCGVHLQYAGYLYRREKQNRTLRNSSSEWQARFYIAMHEKFSDIYAGRFPMGCCGNRKTSVSQVSQTSSTTMTMMNVVGGEDGMTLLRYMGGNYGTEKYYGPYTGLPYKVSVSKPLINVDDRDLHSPKGTGLLDLHVGSKELFVVEPSPEPSPEPSTVDEQSSPEVLEEEESVMAMLAQEEVVQSTSIESGQIKNVTAKVVEKLSLAGITTWEQFLSHDSSDLSEISGLSEDRIDEIRKEIT